MPTAGYSALTGDYHGADWRAQPLSPITDGHASIKTAILRDGFFFFLYLLFPDDIAWGEKFRRSKAQ